MISNRTQNLKTNFVADHTDSKSMSGRISIYEIRDKIRFQILCSIGIPKIQILRSKSGFPNRKHPWIELQLLGTILSSYVCLGSAWLLKYGTTQNDPNPPKTHSKGPKTTNEMKRNKTADKYHNELRSGCIMLRDYGILNYTWYFRL